MSLWHWVLIYLAVCFPLAIAVGHFIKRGNPTDEE